MKLPAVEWEVSDELSQEVRETGHGLFGGTSVTLCYVY
jgi:hypothetical protein